VTPRRFAKTAGNFFLGAAFIAACTINPSPANATTPDTVEVFWLMPNAGTPENVTYPQTYSADGATVPGACYQIDTYSTADAALFTADNTLTEGEDYADVNGPGTGVLSWRFECVPASAARADTVADSLAAKSTAPELAHTGIDIDITLAVGFLLLLTGIIIAAVKAMKKRESK
jgi:hypothetical protein